MSGDQCKCDLTAGHLLTCPWSRGVHPQHPGITCDKPTPSVDLRSPGEEIRELRQRADELDAALARANRMWAEACDKVQAKSERLEAALREIARTPAGQRGTAGHDEWYHMVNVAAAALNDSTRMPEAAAYRTVAEFACDVCGRPCTRGDHADYTKNNSARMVDSDEAHK